MNGFSFVEEAMIDDARIPCGAAVALSGRLKTGTADSAENAEKMTAFSAVKRDLASAAPPALRCVGRICAVGRRAGARRTQEQLPAVRVRHVAAVRPVQRMVSCLVAVDHQNSPDLEGLSGDPAA